MLPPLVAPAPVAPAATRWLAFALLSVGMFGNYYVYDSIGPVADMLQQQLGFTDQDIGTLNAIYSLPNIVMVLAGGVLADRWGPRNAFVAFTAICVLGAAVTAGSSSLAGMATGRLLFGLGAESMSVALSAALGRWFVASTLGLALGLNISFGRLGSYAADLSPTLAKPLYAQGWQSPLWLAAAIMAAGLVAGVLYWGMERTAARRGQLGPPPPTERIVFSDLVRFDRSYWYIAGLCVLFYSAILPFRSTFAIKYYQHAHGLNLEAASTLNSHVFLAAIFATPAFGWLVDRIGRRALLMAVGSLLLPLSFWLLGAGTGAFALNGSTVLLGIAYSLVPGVLWPSVARLVEPHRLGTAYGMMFLVQNVGLTVVNYFVGWLNDHSSASATNVAGYLPMLWFFGILSLLGLGFAFLLRLRETGPHGHGLEVGNAE
ncbi:MAG: MFS transporter [Hymenobacteraceae bacterium]|nr:MFS transporter [Hymenobacteraceae bacterium]